MSLPTLTLPVAPGEYALLQLPRHLTADEYAYVKSLIEVMSPGFIKEPPRDEEISPVEEHVAVEPTAEEVGRPSRSTEASD